MEHKDSAQQNSQPGPKAVEEISAPIAALHVVSSLGAPHRPGAEAAPELLMSCPKLRGHQLRIEGLQRIHPMCF